MRKFVAAPLHANDRSRVVEDESTAFQREVIVSGYVRERDAQRYAVATGDPPVPVPPARTLRGSIAGEGADRVERGPIAPEVAGSSEFVLEWEGLGVVDALRRHIDAPVAAESRVKAALLGEGWQGAAAGLDDVLYVSLRGVPEAALLAGSRSVRGAHFRAGALPAFPELPPAASAPDGAIEQTAGMLADAAALLDPQAIVLYALPQHLDLLVPLTQRVLATVAPGVQVLRAALGHQAAVVGAVRIASTLAFEGHRKP